MKKRIVALLCILCFFITAIPTVVFAGTDDYIPKVLLDASYDKTAKQVTATVTFGKCTDLDAVDFHLKFDADILSVESATGNGSFGKKDYTEINIGKDYIGVAFEKASGETYTDDTLVLTVVFNVNKGKTGDVIFSLDPDVTYFTDISGDHSSDTPAPGSVTSKTVTIVHVHSFVKTAAKAATCIETGNIEYYTCSECGKKYSDAEGKNEVTNVTTEKDPKNHVGETEVKNAKAATCYAEGYTGDTYCKSCGAKISDGKAIEKTAHTESDKWSYDKNYHWKVCSVSECGSVIDSTKAKHDFVWKVDEENKLLYYMECLYCGLKHEGDFDSYYICTIYDDGGFINPGGDVIVSAHTDQSFTIDPEYGYKIKDVEVDGVSIGAVKEYTFKDVDKDHTIYATFERIFDPTTYEPGVIIIPDDITVPTKTTTSTTTTTTISTATTTTTTTTTTKPTEPVKQINTVRISGSDRYGTADHIAAAGWTSADTVIIASGEAYPDALSGAVLAKKYNAPIILTRKGSISQSSLDQISKLGAKKAIILGGYAAVSDSVENSLKDKELTVSRIYGSDRNATAAQIAYNVSNNSNTVILVSNANFADALSVSSSAALNGTPILYLNKDGSIPADTKTAIQKLGAKNAYIIGGTAAIGSKAEENLKALGVTTKRIYGSDRYATSIAVYDNFKSVFTSKDVAIATGANFPDALAGAAFAANKGIPIFLVGSNASTALKERVKAARAENIYVFGGTAVIADNTVTEITA